jgi:hypothetical protein
MMSRWIAVGTWVALVLGSCGSVQIQPSTGFAQDTLTAQASNLLGQGSVSCPPFYKLCGTHQLNSRPPTGGTIVPVEMVLSGQKTIGSSLGQKFSATFPSSGYTKFYAGNLLLTVGALDQSLLNQTLIFTLESSSISQNGVYTFTYVAQ